MPSALNCPRCLHPLPVDAPRGLCPTCLLKGALDDEAGSSGGSHERAGRGTGADADQPNRGTRSRTWDELCETVTYRSAKFNPPRRGVGQRGTASTFAVDLDQFLRALTRVGLMEWGEVQEFLGRFSDEARPGEAEPLALELVRAGRLTEYQAGALLQGKSRGLAIRNYLILDKLGRGGMGLVFKARHRRMKRVVALKLLPPSYAREEAAVLRFLREAEASARLSHPNIVAVLDADEFNGLHFFAMEYVEGSDLARLVDSKGPRPVGQAIDYLTQAARGLKAAHDRHIYHRDIKPSNLMLASGGTVKVLDLGLARMEKEADLSGADGPDPDLTRPGDFMGTVTFMAPEQAYNARDADHRSDIYSLGCTLYYLLTGKPPYSGVTRMACVIAHREHPIPLLRDARPDVPIQLDDILRRMLAKAPEDRYQSIDGLLDDLQAGRVPDLAGRSAAVRTGPGCDEVEGPPGRSEPHEDRGSSGSHPAEADAQGRPRGGPRVPRWRIAIVVAGLSLGGVLAVRVAGLRPRPGGHGDVHTTGNPSERPPPPEPPGPRLGPTPDPPLLDVPKSEERPRPEPVGAVVIFRGHGNDRVQSVAIASDGRGRTFALSAGSDFTVRYWEVATGREDLRFAHEGPVYAVAFLPTDHRRALSAGSDRIIRLWDLDKNKDPEIGRFSGHQKAVFTVAASADGLRVLSGSGDGTVRLWNAATTRELDLREHDGAVYSVAFSPAGPTRALSAGADQSVRLWKLRDDKLELVKRLPGPAPVLCVAFSPDGHRALSGGEDGALTLWNLDRWEEIQRVPGAQDHVRCVTFLPDGRHALSGTVGGKLIVWDVEEDLRPVYPFEGAVGHLGVAAMSDGSHALTADDDGVVRRWKLPEFNEPAGPPEGGPMVPDR